MTPTEKRIKKTMMATLSSMAGRFPGFFVILERFLIQGERGIKSDCFIGNSL